MELAHSPSKPEAAPDVRGVPWAFFGLVFALSIPFFVIGSVTGFQLAPGLPVSALAAFCPVLAAAILVFRENGRADVIVLLKRAFDVAHINDKWWMAPIILLMPTVMVASYFVMRMLGVPLPVPVFSAVTMILLSGAFLVAGVGEELGWSGYAIEPLQQRWGELRAGLGMGMFWAVWHIVPLTQADRSIEWIAWWCLGTVAVRVIMTWLFNHTGHSVFGAAVFHAMINLSWLSFPVMGSHYDPRVTGIILTGVATVMTVVRKSTCHSRC